MVTVTVVALLLGSRSGPPPALAAELLQNGGFDASGASSFAPWQFQVRGTAAATASNDATTKFSGAYAFRATITTAASNRWDAWYAQVRQGTFAVSAGAPLDLTFAARASAGRPITVVFQQATSPYSELFSQVVTLGTGWQTQTLRWTPAASHGQVLLAFNLAEQTGSVWLDAVALGAAGPGNPPPTATATPTVTTTPTSSPTASPTPTATTTPLPTPTPPTSGSLVQNGGFETSGGGWLSPWQFTARAPAAGGAVRDTSNPRAGAASFRADIWTAAPTAWDAWQVQLRQGTFAASAGAPLDVTFAARATTRRPIAIIFQQANSPYSELFNQIVVLTTNWQTFRVRWTPTTSQGQVHVGFNLGEETGSVWLDDVHVGPGTGAPPDPPNTTGVYLGVWQPGALTDLSQVTAFEQQAGRSMAIIMAWQDWGSTDKSPLNYGFLNGVRARGAMPLISWSPANWQGGDQSRYSLASINAGAQDAHIRGWARGLASWGQPVMLRWAHEMNGDWYPWSGDPLAYVTAWRRIHGIFQQEGATNVQWVWSPNVWWPGSRAVDFDPYYPGDAYVDWLGLDGYNYGGGWMTFASVYQYSYARITALSGKPLMVAEVSSNEPTASELADGKSKAAWVRAMYESELPTFPRIRAVVWFNEDKRAAEGCCDWRITSSTALADTYRQAISGPQYRTSWP